MSLKILLTSTSFQDIPGYHQKLLDDQGFNLTKLRGPLKESVLLDIIQEFDGIICGDDEITRSVIEKGKNGKLRVISKYGIGLDKVDLEAANHFQIPVTNCPGINQVTVAEHVFALLLSFIKNIIPEDRLIQNQKWVRLIGYELFGKTIGIIGLGNVGKEVAKRSIAFGMKVIAFDKFKDDDFVNHYGITYADSVIDLFKESDIISLNISLNEESKHLINTQILKDLRPGVIIVNTARDGLVQHEAILKGLESKIIRGYLTDVLEEEPIIPDHPFLNHDNIIITPHIGSRTYENVVKQGTMSVENLLLHIHKGKN